MQRRVTAIYFVLFLVLGAGAYSVIALADAPTIDVPGETYGDNDTFQAGDQEYTVSGLSESGGELKYTNESFTYSATLANNSTVPTSDVEWSDQRARPDEEYRVIIANESDVSSFAFVQEFNVTNRLRDDAAVYNETTTIDGEEHVTYRENNTNRPLSEYLPAPERREVAEGDDLQYQNNGTTVANVSQGEVTLEWVAPKNQTLELSEGGNVTLADDTQYFAHFHSEGGEPRVTLAETEQSYHVYGNELGRQAYFQERMNGLWGVVILSAIAAILVAAMALMPVKG